MENEPGGTEPKKSKSPDLLCKKCEASLLPTSKFCPNCGQKVEKINRNIKIKYVHVCQYCEAEIHGDQNFCQECGFKVKDPIIHEVEVEVTPSDTHSGPSEKEQSPGDVGKTSGTEGAECGRQDGTVNQKQNKCSEASSHDCKDIPSGLVQSSASEQIKNGGVPGELGSTNLDMTRTFASSTTGEEGAECGRQDGTVNQEQNKCSEASSHDCKDIPSGLVQSSASEQIKNGGVPGELGSTNMDTTRTVASSTTGATLSNIPQTQTTQNKVSALGKDTAAPDLQEGQDLSCTEMDEADKTPNSAKSDKLGPQAVSNPGIGAEVAIKSPPNSEPTSKGDSGKREYAQVFGGALHKNDADLLSPPRKKGDHDNNNANKNQECEEKDHVEDMKTDESKSDSAMPMNTGNSDPLTSDCHSETKQERNGETGKSENTSSKGIDHSSTKKVSGGTLLVDASGAVQQDLRTEGTEYRKTQLPNHSNVPSHGMQTRGQTRANAMETINIHFHVVISPGFQFVPNRDQVYVHFGQTSLGGWNQSKWKLEPVRDLRDGYTLLEGKVDVAKEYLRDGRYLEYKYVVHENDSDKKKHCKWEYVFRKFTGVDVENRRLNFKSKALQAAKKIHQYDGIMHTQPKADIFSFILRGVKYLTGKGHRKVIEETKRATLAMMPSWEGLCLDEWRSPGVAQDALENVHQVIQSVGKYFVKEDLTQDGSLVFDVLFDYISPRMEVFSKGLANPETLEEINLRLASALAIIYLAAEYHLSLSTRWKPVLCNALLPPASQPDGPKINFQNVMSQHFPDKKDVVLRRLVMFMHACCSATHIEPRWLYVVPLLHILKGESHPYQPPSLNYAHRTQEWWGVQSIVDVVETYKRGTYAYDGLTLENMEQLTPWFEVDHLFVHTLAATLHVRHVAKAVSSPVFPPEVCLGLLFFHLHNNSFTYQFKNKGEEIVKSIKTKVENLLQELPTKDWLTGKYLLNQCAVCCNIVADVFQETVQKLNYDVSSYSIICETAKLLTSCMATLIQMKVVLEEKAALEEGDTLIDGYGFVQVFLNDCSGDLLNWLQRNLPTNLCERFNPSATENSAELKIWSDLLGIVVVDKELTDVWNSRLMAFFNGRIQRATSEQKVHLFCRDDLGRYHPIIEECVSIHAFRVVEEHCKESATGRAVMTQVDGMNKANAAKFGSLLSRMFNKAWPNEEEAIFSHILNWSVLVGFLKISLGKVGQKSMLNEECFQRIALILSILGQVVEELVKGNIPVAKLHEVLKHKDHFVELYKTSQESLGPEIVPESGNPAISQCMVLIKILNLREQELRRFEHLRKQIQTFLAMCHEIPVEIQALANRVTQNVDKIPLNELCEPVEYSPQATSEASEITFFNLPPVLEHSVLEQMEKIHSSRTFSEFWQGFGKQAYENKNKRSGRNVLSINDVINDVWNPAVQQWQDVCKTLWCGAIKCSEIDQLFSKYIDRDGKLKENELRNEFEILAGDGDKDWIMWRINQMKWYRQLKQYRRGAKVIMDAKKAFKLHGDFSVLEDLINATEDRGRQLGTIKENHVKVGQALKGVGEKEAAAIDIFCQCQHLVAWLRQNIKGSKEVQVFVDLALMTASGQGDMEVDRVTFLHAAVTGFAPLIYELKPDTDFNTFLRLCKTVWNAIERDTDLPKKLFDTNRHLDWLKFVKQSHGDVEVSALAQVETINRHGIYQVGKIKGKQPKTLDGVIQLVIPPRGGKERDSKSYTFQQLTELQSKLMLVAGRAEQGKAQVDRFVEIFDGVTRLAQAYIKICSAGSILFKDWNVKIFCEPSRPNSILIDFGLADQKLKGGGGDDVGAHVRDVCLFIEECLQEWQQYIEKERDNNYHLNHYTTAQLVILRQELAKLSKDGQSPSLKIYPLLSAIKTNVTERDVRLAFQNAFHELAEMEHAQAQLHEIMVEENTVSARQSNEKEPETDAPSRIGVQKFIVGLQEAGFSEKLAKAALVSMGSIDLDDDAISTGILWCMEHDDIDEDMEDEEMEESGNVICGATFESVTEDRHEDEHRSLNISQISFKGLQDTTMDTMVESLLGDLKRTQNYLMQLRSLWKKFLTQVSTSIADYLSVKHLGCVLQQLAFKEPAPEERPMPPYLNTGKPNLITCPQGDLLAMVLSVYMNRDKLPLPTANEVLLCTPETTAEEVELLWRRAIGDQHGHVFCLANADLLDYDISEKTETSLEKLTKGKNNYKLVVVCSQEGEDRSALVTALDSNRVSSPILYSCDNIRAYLKHHFTCTNAGQAATVDPERCCVRVVKSNRAGLGKSLHVKRFKERVEKLSGRKAAQAGSSVSIPLQGRKAVVTHVLNCLIEHVTAPGTVHPRQFHLDVAHEIQEGVDPLLFNLLVLGRISDPNGYVWHRFPGDLYLVETLPLLQHDITARNGSEHTQCVHRMLDLLPFITCRDPSESLEIMARGFRGPGNANQHDQLMDWLTFTSKAFQRVYQYLKRFTEGTPLENIFPEVMEGDPSDCIQYLLRYCGIQNPTWAELRHFVWFLNVQLEACEQSNFCSAAAAEALPGFRQFVVRFMIQMSKDFATRSLNMAEETPGMDCVLEEDADEDNENDLVKFQLRRHWETSPHPYIFFNPDHHSLTFLGFNIDRKTQNLLDHQTGHVLEQAIMTQDLQVALYQNQVPLDENFDGLPRCEKIRKLCSVMGIELIWDPDETYELTTDNVKKILAIHMRFRCGIPVIVMGETGCGKTRLIKFMCDLQKPPGVEDIENMVLMKVHGGTTEEEILSKVKQAGEKARENKALFSNMDTVLFFDEANTTEAIGLIKEIMCDGTIGGKPLPHETFNIHGLKLIAACNPYRKHTEAMIERLEQAGLGYHVESGETKDKLGRIPMRQLVYRVQALPPSMRPLVWDFGQLSPEVEILYIRQIVNRYVNSGQLPDGDSNPGDLISRVLAASQEFMRQQEHECSFVSLRDVERAMNVMVWFYDHSGILFPLMNEKYAEEERQRRRFRNEEVMEDDSEEEEEEEFEVQPLDDMERSLILALGVCYYACLEERQDYCEHVSQEFNPDSLPQGKDNIIQEISRCQDVFLDAVHLGPNIARNQALRENVFMMVVCIELRIPLFLVGKPGSSKSLAKTIVADAMQGNASSKDLFKNLKQVHMISFQCSPLATPEGIVSTFHQCARLQKDKDLDKFVSVVVLDEVGLAEDSPRMPLKTLHPLLEDGCQGDEEPLPYKKVAFIGISNWALDPAKMNRGILVQRGVPDEKELIQSAKGICSTDQLVQDRINPFIPNMAAAYLELYLNSTLEIREFFGLRDFYSLVKMVYAFSSDSGKPPTYYQLEHAISRNFGGLDDVSPLDVFRKKMHIDRRDMLPEDDDPDCSAAGLICAGLQGKDLDSESRYLLILTENYAALGILQQHLQSLQDAIIIFGSSFPKDQEYTQVCRNINRIKVCMEAGKTVVLLNLENLYESLYDALNQYYVYLGGQRFVDLGLGTHRVKCRVHQDFRLIVVAEKQVVYERFPIPLLNRLEKHFLATTTVLTPEQIALADHLDEWAKGFATVHQNNFLPTNRNVSKPQVGDAFIGYHADTAASVTLQVCKKLGQDSGDEDWQEQVLQESQGLLLQCATPDALLRLRQTMVSQDEEERLVDIYSRQQKHESLGQLLRHLLQNSTDEGLFVQVTTHARLLSHTDVRNLERFLKRSPKSVSSCALQSFDTEQQFSKRLREFFSAPTATDRILLIQCDSGNQHSRLIACARYNIIDEFHQAALMGEETISHGKTHVVLVVQLPRIAGGCFVGFQGGLWHCIHLDELRPGNESMPPVFALRNHTVSELLGTGRVGQGDGIAGQLQAMQLQGDEETRETTETYLHASDSGVMSDSDPFAMEVENVDLVQVQQSYSDDSLMEVQEGDLLSPGSRSFGATEGWGQPKELIYSRTEEVGVENVLISDYGFNQASASVLEAGRNQPHLDGITLLIGCIHAAASMLKDSHDKQRTTQRIQILRDLFEMSDGDTLCFSSVVHSRVHQLLLDKEKNSMNPKMAAGWLNNEAAAPSAINKSGTLRRSVQSCLEAKVAPVLAGVVALADTNYNLDLLHGNSEPWLRNLWLTILCDPEITILKHQDLQSTSQTAELKEIAVQTTGCEGKAFQGQCPFSWLIKQQVDSLYQEALSSKGDEDIGSLVDRLLSATRIGYILDKSCDEHHRSILLELYLQDYIRMVYRARSQYEDMEYQLVVKAVRNVASHLLLGTSENTRDQMDDVLKPLTFPAIHEAYQGLQTRLQYFSQAVCVWPEAIPLIIRFQEENPGMPLNSDKEMTLDVQAMMLVLESLTPANPKQLNEAASQQEWVRHVEATGPVIDRILTAAQGFTLTGLGAYGPVCMEYIEKQRRAWNRVCAVRMFIDHVCTGMEKQGNLAQAHMFWKLLTEDTDFKTKASMQKVVKFLKLCNNKACQIFYRNLGDCTTCGKVLDSPVQLPCKHYACFNCLQDLWVMDDRHCAKCNQEYPEDFELKPLQEKREATEAHAAYKQRCNVFFLALVTQLVFGSDTPPDGDVINMLMGCVTRESRLRGAQQHKARGDLRRSTKQLTVLDDCIDPTPVVRSVLLQMLLSSSITDVHTYLEEYLTRARMLLNEEPSHILELCLLCVQCFEDSYHMRASKVTCNVDQSKLELAEELLRDAHILLREHQEVSIDTLEAVAMARFGLSITSTWMYKMHILGEESKDFTRWARRLFDAAAALCDQDQLKWPRLYLLKQLSRCYGQECVRQVAVMSHLHWILPTEARENQTEDHADRYIVWGAGYQTLRETVAKVALGQDVKTLKEVLKGHPNKQCERQVQLLLAFHREVTLTHLDQKNAVTGKVIQELQKMCQQKKIIRHQALQDLSQRLLSNELGQTAGHLVVQQGKNAEDVMLAEIALHFLLVMLSLDSSPLLEPLMNLLNNPQAMQGSYLPTMPQDEFVEVHNALLNARNVPGADPNPTVWECPDGHKYIIGDCGRPYYTRQCPECGKQIGGSSHTPAAGNRHVQNVPDNTEQGHILGSPDRRNRQPVPERSLSPGSTAILRMFTHLAMYHAAIRNPQAVAPLIRPNIDPRQVAQFLWNHLKQDLHIVAQALGRSQDDSATTLHILIRDLLLATNNPGRGGSGILNSKQERQAWETNFSNAHITHIITNLDQLLQTTNETMINDNRLGGNPLLRVLYEVDQDLESDVDLENILQTEVLWRFRSRVSVEHLSQVVQERCTSNQNEQVSLSLLDLFLKRGPHLQAMQFLPSIIRLQRHLVRKFNHKVDLSEATNLRLRDFVEKQGLEQEEVRDLIADFSRAWSIVRHVLPTHGFGKLAIPREYCESEISGNTSLALLLPSLRGPGVCSAAMVNFLVSLHNTTIDSVERITKCRTEQELSVNEATSAHLISYDPDRDLLPLVLANCNYSLEQGKGTHLQYDLPRLQRQIYDRFLKGRPHLRSEIKPVHFREDMTNATVFENLKNKILQVPLDLSVQLQIQGELQLAQAVSEALASLDITLGFLVSVGGNGNMPLVKFMEDKLHMDVHTISSKARQVCCLKHVQSLWLLLSHKRAQLMARHGQDPFEGQLDEGYCKELSHEQVAALHKALRHVNTETFLAELYECILLQITAPSNPSDPDPVDNKEYPLGAILGEYLDSKEGPNIRVLQDGEFPPDILAKHAVDTWRQTLQYGILQGRK